MSTNDLHDIKAGDEVALQSPYGYRCGHTKEVVEKTTPTLIFLKGYESLKFKKESGYSAGRQRLIRKITPDIQEDWDKAEAIQELKELIESESNGITFETLQKVIAIIIAKTPAANKMECRNVLKTLLTLRLLSSDTLKEAIEAASNSNPK